MLGAFLLAIGYHYLDKMLHPVEPHDFSEFEKQFYARLDSIQQSLKTESTSSDTSTVATATALSEKSASNEAGSSPDLININTAAINELITLPGIGPVIAGRIVEYREQHGPFFAKKDITSVKGIGPKTYQKLKKLIRVD
ncbi:MAG: hypothetical protein GWN13_23855 [Phycisphaerae bacterium]|nr:hypothetical protein [Phycisphaerae bacterium]